MKAEDRMISNLSGAVDYSECPHNGGMRCHCGICEVCGFNKHTAIHGPVNGGSPGSRPFGHRYTPKREKERGL